MGVVYRALDPRSERRVALKLLLDASDRFRERFSRESRLLARLSHPNVVRVHDAGEEQGKPYLVMELVEGTNLEQVLRRGPLEPHRAVEIVASVARGAGHAHVHGLVHRDVKPDNVLLRPDGRAVLTDFGLARDVEVASELSKTGIFMGTPGYASPEQASGDGKRVGPASDVYGLGALLFALLSGRPPVTGSLLEVLVFTMSEPAPSPRAENPEVDATLDALCLRCMAKDPGSRYPDGDALADALEAYLRGELSAPPRDLRPVYVVLGLLVIVALGGALLFAQGGSKAGASPPPEVALASASATPSATPIASPGGELAPSRVLARALRRAADPPSGPPKGDRLDATIDQLAGALERAGRASNRPEAEGRLAVLHTLRSESLFRRTPAQSVADLRAALALESTQPRKDALSGALLRRALVLGGSMAKGVEWERAKEAYLEAMALSPHDSRPALILGEQARTRKDYELWLSANEEAARRAPDDERPEIQISRALARADRRAEAFERLRRFLAAHPKALGAWAELGDQERAAARWGSARRAYERAGGEGSADTDVLEGLAYVALEEQRYELALELCERVSERRPRSRLPAVRALALRPFHRKLEEALPEFEAAWGLEESEPLLGDLANGHLDALRRLDRDKEADARLEFFLADPRLGKHAGLVARQIHYGSTKRHSEAAQVRLSIHRVLDPALDPRADCAYSEWLIRWGTYDLPEVALSSAARAARAKPNDGDAAAYTLIGRALMRLGRYGEAWSALDKAVELHPERNGHHHTRTELGALSGHYERGLASGRRARELRPDDVYVCVYMTHSLLALGRGGEALPLMDFFVTKLGNPGYGLRAWARACAGEVEGARQDLKRARGRDPKAREIRLAEAQLLLHAGDRPGALKAFTSLKAERLRRHEKDFVKLQLALAKQP